MCQCKFRIEHCLVSCFAHAQTNTSDCTGKGILADIHILLQAFGVEEVTGCTIVSSCHTSNSKLYARINVEAVLHLHSATIFSTQGQPPGIIIAFQLMAHVIINCIIIIKLTAFNDYISIMSLVAVPAAIY